MNTMIVNCTITDTEVIAKGVELTAMAGSVHSDQSGINAIVQTRNKEIQIQGFLKSNVPCDVVVGLVANGVIDEMNAILQNNIIVTPEGVSVVITGINNAAQKIVEYGLIIIFATNDQEDVTVEYSDFNVYI